MTFGATATQRVSVVVAGALGLVVLVAPPASADPPKPTDYRSHVLHVDPSLPADVKVKVVGGDAFLELSVPKGHRAIVPDYGSDPNGRPSPTPYLRFGPTGRVERNRLATATAANESRFGASTRAPDPSAAPRWETVSTDGTYAWHDHRIHWMAPSKPRVFRAGGRVDLGGPHGTWEVPLVIDGHATTVTGELLVRPSPSPLPWLGLALVAAAAGFVLGGRSRRSVVAVAAAVVALAATGTAWVTWRAAPAGAGATIAPVLVAVTAVVGAMAVGWAPSRWRLLSLSLTAAALGGWAALRLPVLTNAELPTTLAFPLDRAATAIALGFGVALGALALRKPPSGTERSNGSP